MLITQGETASRSITGNRRKNEPAGVSCFRRLALVIRKLPHGIVLEVCRVMSRRAVILRQDAQRLWRLMIQILCPQDFMVPTEQDAVELEIKSGAVDGSPVQFNVRFFQPLQ